MSSISRALNAKMIGTSGDCVVLAHGFGSDQSAWGRLADQLSHDRRVVLYDLACAGSAEAAFFDLRRHGSLDGHVEDLLAILREIGVARCTFVGHSVSAIIGLLAARSNPSLFSKLVMLGASARYMNDESYHGGFSEEDLQGVFDAIAKNYRSWAQSYVPYVMDRPTADPATQTFLASMLAMRPDIALVTARVILLSDYRSVLDECRIPCALLQAQSDPAVPLSAAQYLNDHLAGSVLDILNVSGHLPHISSPDVVYPALRRHLA